MSYLVFRMKIRICHRIHPKFQVMQFSCLLFSSNPRTVSCMWLIRSADVIWPLIKQIMATKSHHHEVGKDQLLPKTSYPDKNITGPWSRTFTLTQGLNTQLGFQLEKSEQLQRGSWRDSRTIFQLNPRNTGLECNISLIL